MQINGHIKLKKTYLKKTYFLEIKNFIDKQIKYLQLISNNDTKYIFTLKLFKSFFSRNNDIKYYCIIHRNTDINFRTFCIFIHTNINIKAYK